MIGFMGCSAAINALKVARHIVRSEPSAQVLAVNLELCTLHLKETDDIEQILSFLIFADGCAASLISADPTGIAIDRFHTILAPGTRQLISWHIRESGFDMILVGPRAARDPRHSGGGVRRDPCRGKSANDRPLGGASGRPLGA